MLEPVFGLLLLAQTGEGGAALPLAATGGTALTLGYLIKYGIDKFAEGRPVRKKPDYNAELCAERHRVLNGEMMAIRDRNALVDGKIDKMTEVLIETRTLVLMLVEANRQEAGK